MNATINNPFVGLRPFESNEDFLFFGRDEQTLELLQRLHRYHFVAVIGSSGSGKSSLIKASLIPALEGGYLVNECDRWHISSMKPGQDPLYHLADTVLAQKADAEEQLSTAGFVEKIKEEGADAILRFLKSSLKTPVNYFLLVDQFEELFRFCLDAKGNEGKEDATDFVNILLQLAAQKELPVYVVITMRSDFIGDCTQFFGLPEALNESQYLVPRLSRTQLKTTIEGPARLFKRKVSPALTARLLNDTQTVKDELPLLQHALMRTWNYEIERDGNGELDIQDYENIGGLEKALSNHADEALSAMSVEEQALTKKLFQALTAMDENGRKVRRPARLSELEQLTGAGKDKLLSLINRFIDDGRSFLVINKTGTKNDWLIDISHESLIRQWSTLSGWVDEEAEAAKAYNRLTESAHLFASEKKDLLAGSELQLALQWCKEFKPSRVWAQRYNTSYDESLKYLKESENLRNLTLHNQRAKRRIARLLLAALAVLVIAGLFFYGQQKAMAADKQEKAAKEANALRKSAETAAELAKQAQAEAEQQKAIAVQNAVSAEEAKQDAIDALRYAKTQEQLAVHTAAKARRLALKASDAEEKTARQNEAFHLILQARQRTAEDPTDALYLAMEAVRKFPDPLIENGANQIYAENAFYKRLNDQNSYFTAARYLAGKNEFLLSDVVHDFHYNERTVRSELWPASGKQPFYFTHTDSMIIYAKEGLITSASIAYTNDGKHLLIATGDSAVLKGADTNKTMHFRKSGFLQAVAFSPDDKKILTGLKTGAILWSRNEEPLLNLPAGNTIFVSFSPDNKTMVTAAADSTVKIWNEKGEQTATFKLTSLLDSVVFSASGNAVLTKARDSIAVVHRLDSLLPRSFRIPGKTLSMAFSPNGQRYATSTNDNIVRLWMAGDTLHAKELRGHNGDVTALSFSPGGAVILSGARDKTARLWTIDGKLLTVFKGHSNGLNYVGFSGDGTKIFTASADGSVREWHKPVTTFPGHISEINLVAVSPKGNMFLTGSADTTARLWNKNGRAMAVMPHPTQVASVAFSPDGRQLATVSGTLTYVWANDGLLLRELTRHDDIVQSVAFSPDGETILTGSDDRRVILWNLRDSGFLEFMHPDGVVAVAYSRDGKRILTACRDGIARLWNLTSRTLEASFKHARVVHSVAFSPSGDSILTGSGDRKAVLWNKSGEVLRAFSHHDDVESVAFSPDGTKVLTGSWDGTVKLWTTEAKLLLSHTLPDRVRSVAFTPDGKKFFVGCSDGTARLFPTSTLTEFLKSLETGSSIPVPDE